MRATWLWCVLCLGCSSATLDGGNPGDDAGLPSGPTCDPLAAFSAPMPIAGFATSTFESTARLSHDELAMYFTGSPGTATSDLYVAVRTGVDQPFGPPMRLAASSTIGADDDPTVGANDLTLMFSSDRDGPQRIYAATRMTALGDFGPPALVAWIAASSDVDSDVQPFLTADGQELWFSSTRDGGLGGLDIWRATRSADSFASQVAVPELNSALADELPVLSRDQLTVYFSSTRPGAPGGARDVWRATRATVQDHFGAPRPVPELETAGDDYVSWISPDSCRIYLASNARGTFDIYLATRSVNQ